MKDSKSAKNASSLKSEMMERRQSQRIPLVVMEVKGKQANRLFLAYANDISEGGLSLTTESNLRVGDRIPIEMMLPDNKTKVSCTGEVVWKREIMKDGIISQGVGVRFLDLEDGKKRAIEKLSEPADKGKKGSKR
ncbi:MAG: PilZ domain-containing protein [Nitrospirae bacterium]|nr:PilZ domain-containing protein [Nitrospirota bacterium]